MKLFIVKLLIGGKCLYMFVKIVLGTNHESNNLSDDTTERATHERSISTVLVNVINLKERISRIVCELLIDEALVFVSQVN